MKNTISNLQRFDLIGADSDLHIGPESCGDYVKYADVIAALQHAGQEPEAWMFQHEATGRTTFVELGEAEVFAELNPRLQKVCPLYKHPQPAVPDEAEPLPSNHSSWDAGFNEGWNACRDEMLSAGKENNNE
jgi:hypothetical protein